MVAQKANHRLHQLYEEDETAWLEETASLLAERRDAELDRAHLIEYLNDLARRDKKEVRSRLIELLKHLLKWTFQPSRRTRSWERSIIIQRDELQFDLASKSLRNFAEEILPEAYEKAVGQATRETGLPRHKFPQQCPYSIDQALAVDVSLRERPN